MKKPETLTISDVDKFVEICKQFHAFDGFPSDYPIDLRTLSHKIYCICQTLEPEDYFRLKELCEA